MMKTKYLMILLAAVMISVGCSKDDEETASPFIGNYVISKAAVAVDFDIVTTTPGVSVPIAADTDITAAVQQSLLSAVTCSSANDSYIELREDQSMYMSCKGENALNAGTWEEVSPTELKLNMNNAAIPTSPSGFVLTVSNIVFSGNKMVGVTTVPMPKEMFMPALEGTGLTIADTPPIYMVTFSIEQTKM